MNHVNSPSIINVEEVRKQAMQSLAQGSVTSDYKLDINQACLLLNEALASEIVCMLRYRHHQVIVKGIHSPQIAAEFQEHALSEEAHAMLIAERINQLGGNPDFNPTSLLHRSTTEYGEASDILAMLKEDLVAERIAINVYRKLISWFGDEDPTTRRMLEHILQDEEEHANDLADLLAWSDLNSEKH